MARNDGHDGAVLEYRNPLTGGPALATIACSLQGLPAGGCTTMMRETASSVCFVARGGGTITANGVRLPFAANDVVAIPAWTWHQLRAEDDELVVFRISDRPLHDAFGLYRAETSTR
jgi:gentisate 1,2-dioxygenase